MADEEAKFRKRLLAMTLVRLAGLAIALFGVAVFYTGLLREGGWPQVGAILIVLGTIDSVFAPMLLKRQWDREDQ